MKDKGEEENERVKEDKGGEKIRGREMTRGEGRGRIWGEEDEQEKVNEEMEEDKGGEKGEGEGK